ncbi:hypothetical protein SO694_000960102 [Aureococcus anophagefferens]|uniref:rRNA biogenesis protein RRP36 n=1 Tax=Aureococcus anophagefferens TaxID=44056 RepID=A0ABR1FSC0_AURAN
MARGLEAQLAAFENASDDDDSSDGGGDSVDHDELARAGEAASSDDDESDGEADASDDEGYDSEAGRAAAARGSPSPRPRACRSASGSGASRRRRRRALPRGRPPRTCARPAPRQGDAVPAVEERASGTVVEETSAARGPSRASRRSRPCATRASRRSAAPTTPTPRRSATAGSATHEAEEISRKQGQLKTKKGRKDAGLKAEVDDAVRKRKQRKHDERKRDVVRSMKRAERTKVKAGKQPYYAKKSVVKQRLLEDRFDQLKKAGKLNGFLRKKARKPTSLLEAGRGPEARGACASARARAALVCGPL